MDVVSLLTNMDKSQKEMCHSVTNAPKDENISRTEAKGHGHSYSKTVCDTPRPQDVFTH